MDLDVITKTHANLAVKDYQNFHVTEGGIGNSESKLHYPCK